MHPGAEEACNGVDDDCNGTVDDGSPTTPWYPDADGAGWGTATGVVEAGAAPFAYAAQSGDCDDADPAVHPDALDLAGNGLDANCDGDLTCESLVVFEGDWTSWARTPRRWPRDSAGPQG